MSQPSPKPECRRFLRKGELSLRLGVSLRTIDRWNSRKLIPSFSLMGMRLYDAVAIDNLMVSLAQRGMKHRPARHNNRKRKGERHRYGKTD